MIIAPAPLVVHCVEGDDGTLILSVRTRDPKRLGGTLILPPGVVDALPDALTNFLAARKAA